MAAPKAPVGVVVVGAGRWGPNLIRNIHENPTSRLLWVVDKNPERLVQVRQRFPEVRVATRLEEVLGEAGVDAVVVATPARTHHHIAMASLLSGKHCLVEKPLAPDFRLALELCQTAEARKLTLGVGHVFLHNGAVQAVKTYINQGVLGDPRYASMVRTNLGPAGIDVNVAWDLASHDISIANYWLDARPVSVSAVGGKWVDPELEDTIFATLEYPGGRLVHLNVSWLNPQKTRHITLVGSRRMVTLDDTSLTEPVRLHDKGIDSSADDFVDSFGSFRASVREGDITVPRVVTGEPLRAEWGDFVDAIVEGRDPASSGRQALDVVRTVEAINRSVCSHGAQVEVAVNDTPFGPARRFRMAATSGAG